MTGRAATTRLALLHRRRCVLRDALLRAREGTRLPPLTRHPGAGRGAFHRRQGI